MNVVALAAAPSSQISLPALVDRAAKALASAKTAAEILDARDMAGFAADTAKRAARIAKARKAADEVIAACFRAEADAHEIQALAKRRLADEYDAAQERGEVASKADGDRSSKAEDLKPTVADIGLSHKDIHEARQIRDAEVKEPGVVRRALDEALDAGEEPTKAKVRRAITRVLTEDEPPPRPRGRRETICIQVRETVAMLSGLPPPAEVVGYFKGTDAAILVGERLAEATRWLEEFAAEWTKVSND